MIRARKRLCLMLPACLAGPALAAGMPATNGDALAAFRPLVGRWECHGTFARSGAPIGATLAIAIDETTRSLSVRHDDLPPNAYHALEFWSPAGGGGFRAAIVDASGGMRWLTSPGWRDGALEWERRDDGRPKERFRYTLGGDGRFTVAWFVVDAAGRATLGDSIDCAPA
jgi:hypothetical protein